MNAAQYSDFAERFPRPDMKLVNDRSIEVARTHMESLCRETIDLVYDGIAASLEKDEEVFNSVKTDGFQPGSVIGSYVRQDNILTAPSTEETFVKTFFTRLEPEAETLTRRQREDIGTSKQYLDIHIPALGMDIGDFVMPPKDEIEEIYVEVNSDDFKQWFGITRSGLIYEYEPPKFRATGEVPDDTLWADFNNRVPDGIKIITDIFQRVSNWRTMPQNIEIIST